MSSNVNIIKDVVESLYPPQYAESWDNTGFQVNLNNNTNRVLVCLDVTEAIIQEAAEKGCWMIVAHHPLIFDPVSRIDNSGYVGKCTELLIKNGISLYSAHTSADSAPEGLNYYFAGMLGLEKRELLMPERMEKYYKIAVSVPPKDSERVREAMDSAGAGKLGNYTGCTFAVEGKGTFMPNEKASPHIGRANELEVLDEVWIQALVPESRLDGTVYAIREAHPYEEPAIDIFMLKEPRTPEAGLGIIGEFRKKIAMKDVLDMVKEKLLMDTLRFRGDIGARVKRVAVCGGAGGSFADIAAARSADLYITGEVKHNQYLEAKVNIAEAGHHDTEKCFCAMMAGSLQKALVDVKCNVSVYMAERTERPYIDY